jgi:protein TonB
MSRSERRTVWWCFGIALILHGVSFAALDRWMRIGVEMGAPTVISTLDYELARDLEPAAPAFEPLPVAEEPPPTPETFPEVLRPEDAIVAAVEPVPLDPFVDAAPGTEEGDAEEPYEARALPGTIGLGGGVWRPGGNVRFGHGGVAGAGAAETAPAPARPHVAAAVTSPPPPAGATRPPQFGVAPEPPEYPLVARRRGWEGLVLLRIEVSASGEITSVRVGRSSGRDLLDEAAVEAAKSWRLAPALEGGTPVAGALDVPVRFRLDS